MWNAPTPERLATLVPNLYAQDGIPQSKQIVHAHFFIGGCDWWITEYNPEDDEAYGFARLNGDDQMSEWGYIPISELRQIRTQEGVEVDFDRYWKRKPCSEIPEIKVYA